MPVPSYLNFTQFLLVFHFWVFRCSESFCVFPTIPVAAVGAAGLTMQHELVWLQQSSCPRSLKTIDYCDPATLGSMSETKREFLTREEVTCRLANNQWGSLPPEPSPARFIPTTRTKRSRLASWKMRCAGGISNWK